MAFIKKAATCAVILSLACSQAAAFADTSTASTAAVEAASIFTPTQKEQVHPLLVALGDSIPYGFNLGNNQAPSPLAYPYLIGQREHASVEDLAVPGSTSTDLLHALTSDTYKQALAHASIVTVDIGSNDLLSLAEHFGLLKTPDAQITPDQLQQFKGAIQQFGKNLPIILQLVHKQAPNAQILLYNLYDPFGASAAALHALAEQMEGTENQIIAGAAASMQLPVMDAYKAFDGKQLGYVRPNDVHPTVEGQQVLASLTINFLENPARLVARAEFAAMVIRALGIQPDTAGTLPFTDVKTGDWFAGSVNAAVKAGIVSGYPDGTFRPNQEMTREEMLQMIINAMKANGRYHATLSQQEIASILSPYTDANQVQPWAKEAEAIAVQAGITVGTGPHTLAPAADADRGHAVSFLHRMMQKLGVIRK